MERKYEFVIFNLILIVAFSFVYMKERENFTGIDDMTNAAYFAIITQSSVGYGDILPKTNRGKMIVMVHVMLSMCINLFKLINPTVNTLRKNRI